MINTILALILGVFFGLLLQKAGLTKYNKIVNVFRFTDMAVLKFMMTALVVAMTGLYALKWAGVIVFPSVPATYIAGNVIGGLIFGMGMAFSGYCPGTCVAGAGEGKLDYIVPGLLGFTTGAAIYGLLYPQIFPKISAIANYGAAIIPSLWNVSAALVIIFFALLSLLLFYLIDRSHMQRRDKMGAVKPN